MKRETKRNFWLSGVALGLVAVFGVYGKLAKQNCSDEHSTLVLIDFTDEISPAARRVVKDRVWAIIEGAPDYSRVVFKRIVGGDWVGSNTKDAGEAFCRMPKPGPIDGLKGKTIDIKKNWANLKGRVCGKIAESVDKLPLRTGDELLDAENAETCGSEKRDGSFFDKPYSPSVSSPILESIVDNSREYLTNTPKTWDFVVVTDWREYTANLNMQTKSCKLATRDSVSSVPIMTAPGKKVLWGEGGSERKSTITILFVLRNSMDNAEANCLESFGRRFVLTNIDGNSVAPPVFDRLPRSVP